MTPPPAPPPPPAASAFHAPTPGATLAAWRASAPWRAAAACGPAPEGGTVCRAGDPALGPRYRARGVTATFRDGRLASTTFATSLDGFAAAMAELRAAFGDPTEIVRDRARLEGGRSMPHVRVTWRTPAARVNLSDPDPGGRIRVTIAAPDAPRRADA